MSQPTFEQIRLNAQAAADDAVRYNIEHAPTDEARRYYTDNAQILRIELANGFVAGAAWMQQQQEASQ